MVFLPGLENLEHPQIKDLVLDFAESRKIKKKMTHHELISEVLMTLRFPAEASDIKRRIESLIERELLGTGFGAQLDTSGIPSSGRLQSQAFGEPKIEKWQLDSLADIPLGRFLLNSLKPLVSF